MGSRPNDRNTLHTAHHSQALAERYQAPRQLTALLSTQTEAGSGFGQGTAFFATVQAADNTDWSCDRREFFDVRGRLVLPDYLGQTQGLGLDPCAALAIPRVLKAGERTEQVFLLGYAASPAAARVLVATAAASAPLLRLDQQQQQWDTLLGATTVHTPDPLFDAMVNRWLLYQTISCRLWAKAGFYQAGGATGFRDQLQDTMALHWAAPQLLRAQILRCAARQFTEGDVQHWWHSPGGAGVRTHFSDDLLWLPHAIAHYLRHTADDALLDEKVPFLDSSPIPAGAEDLYNTPTISTENASVYEHAARTIDRSLRVGSHGLPLIGSGDWNDGMNQVGIEGRGESVWLGWFLCQLVADFGPIARRRGDTLRAQRWDAAAVGWKAALLGPAWDVAWVKRAFFDNGEPLGSHRNTEAKIDLIAQAWSVLSNVAPAAMQTAAMAAVQTHLIDPHAGLIRLLDPPLRHAQPSAGYIQAYPAGVRENGGQYTHAGVWALMAQAQLAVSVPIKQRSISAQDQAYCSFTLLSAAHRASHPQHGPVYGLEPYVMAADVYSQAPYVGRGGWSWYTGAAGLMHRAAIEAIFGLKQDAHQLSFQPCLPSHWPEAELILQRGPSQLRFIFLRASCDIAQTTMAKRQRNSQTLSPGQALPWPLLAGQHLYVVPLL